MSNFTLAVSLTSASSPTQVADAENRDRMVHVRVVGATDTTVGIGFTSGEVDAASKGLRLYGGANAGGFASTVSFLLPEDTELWVGPTSNSGVIASFLVVETR